MRKSTQPLTLAALSVLAAAPSAAHDIWLHAQDFTPESGAEAVVRQLVGADMASDLLKLDEVQELPVLRDMTPRFALVTAEGETDLLAEPAAGQPVFEGPLEQDGLALLAMDHDVLYGDFTREEFVEYLVHEGLEVGRYTPHMGEAEYQVEGHQRTLKSLLRAGSAKAEAPVSDLPARVLGQSIEILLLQNPYGLDVGDTLDVKVLLHGQPLGDQLVQAYASDGDGSVDFQELRTGEGGVVRFEVESAGAWVVRLVHLAPCTARSGVDCSDTQWASYWSAYSFAID